MDSKTVVRRFLEEVANTGDVARVPEFVSQDCRASNDPTSTADGIEAMRAHLLGVRTTFPDLHLEVEQQIAEGEWVATRVTATGTHLGEWLGMRPTGKPVAITAVNLDRVVDGRLVERGGAANMFEALRSIGAIRVVSSDVSPPPDQPHGGQIDGPGG